MLPSFEITVSIPLSTEKRSTSLIRRSIDLPSLNKIIKFTFSRGSGAFSVVVLAAVRVVFGFVVPGVVVAAAVFGGGVVFAAVRPRARRPAAGDAAGLVSPLSADVSVTTT